MLLGGSGQVGTALSKRLEKVTAPARKSFDLAAVTADDVRRLIRVTDADVVINCAGYTAVDRAEDEPDIALRINGEAVRLLAEATAIESVPLVTFSTDYVFNGRSSEPYLESSTPDPVNTYGASKLAGERSSIEANPLSLVIRTSWVVSDTHPNFVATMLRLAKSGEPFQVVSDQHGCPTIADDLAAATISALSESITGLLHLTNQGPATWFELAVEAVGSAGLDPGLVLPCSTADFPTRAKRPAYSVLESERLEHLAVSPLPGWRSSLPDLVARLQETPHV